jgi:hypothetical protein
MLYSRQTSSFSDALILSSWKWHVQWGSCGRHTVVKILQGRPSVASRLNLIIQYKQIKYILIKINKIF